MNENRHIALKQCGNLLFSALIECRTNGKQKIFHFQIVVDQTKRWLGLSSSKLLGT